MSLQEELPRQAAVRRAARKRPVAWGAPLPVIYRRCAVESWDLLPSCRPLDHTMYDALDDYVAQKLPVDALRDALLERLPIEIHGIYPDHFPVLAESLGWSDLVPVAFRPSRRGKRLNNVRPVYFRGRRAGRESLVIAVTPGREYLRHYAGLVRHHLFLHTSRAEEHISVVRYPEAERTIAHWTGFDRAMVRPGDTVVLGYVDEIEAMLLAAGVIAPLGGSRDTSFYSSRRYRSRAGRTVNFIGVRFSFWGGIAGRLAAAACQRGAQTILYCGKLGALSSPSDVYTRIFCPSAYHLLEHSRFAGAITAPPNPILERFPELDSAAHVSVPTVIEEDYLQRTVAAGLSATSIDNEIAHMAGAVSAFNGKAGTTGFAALHFATDYVRGEHERSLPVPLNLSNNRTTVALDRKQQAIARLCDRYLGPYLDA